jgi:hypothetical protein
MSVNLTVALIGWFMFKYGLLFGLMSIKDALLLSGSAVCIVVSAVWEQLDSSCSALQNDHVVVYILAATLLQYTFQSRRFGHVAVAVMVARLFVNTCIIRAVAALAIDLGLAAMA